MNTFSPVVFFCVAYFAAGVLALHWVGGFSWVYEKRKAEKEDRGFFSRP